ncbi:MAG TPA: DivIVA domain-containing protein [Gemmatimonadaceae bacterium]|nr:DivIVA domain-containing protein [Gemmatimonadaceae bacterium]
MPDESFHLTPLDIRRYDFGSALRGYDKTRVDQFRDQVAHEVERLVRQCQDLENKAKGFHEQLRAFRERDKALNEALVSAQQLRGEIREQAEREGQLILREARAEAERIVHEARTGLSKVEADLEALVRQRRAYLAQLRGMIERQLAEIEAAEAAPATMLPARPVQTAPAAPGAVPAGAVPAGMAPPSMAPPAPTPPAAPPARAAGGPSGVPARDPAVAPNLPPEEIDVGPRDATETPPWLHDLVKE